jgi:hypothetical protein
MLLRHVSPTPIIASPARPKVNTPIKAAFLFCPSFLQKPQKGFEPIYQKPPFFGRIKEIQVK